MAQEQAKSAPEKETSDDKDTDKDTTKGSLEAMMRGTSEDEVDDTPTLPRRSTLADRLKAEQHKRDEPHSEAPQQREEPKVQTKPQPKPQGKMLPLKPPNSDAAPKWISTVWSFWLET